MAAGQRSISRGHQAEAARAVAPRLARGSRPQAKVQAEPVAEPAQLPAPASPEYRRVHARLTALERLTRLFEQGALSAEEFAAEKALVLKLPADELLLVEAASGSPGALPSQASPRGPSLLGRLLSWKVLPAGLAAGLALSYASQPRETTRFFEEALRLFGA
jgi:hypothetical protein